MKFNEKGIELLKQALEKFGIEAQVNKTTEECAELIQVLMKYQNHSLMVCHKDIIDEIADVIICVEQMAIYFDKYEVKRRIEYKMDRLNLVLNEELVLEPVMEEEESK